MLYLLHLLGSGSGKRHRGPLHSGREDTLISTPDSGGCSSVRFLGAERRLRSAAQGVGIWGARRLSGHHAPREPVCRRQDARPAPRPSPARAPPRAPRHRARRRPGPLAAASPLPGRELPAPAQRSAPPRARPHDPRSTRRAPRLPLTPSPSPLQPRAPPPAPRSTPLAVVSGSRRGRPSQSRPTRAGSSGCASLRPLPGVPRRGALPGLLGCAGWAPPEGVPRNSVVSPPGSRRARPGRHRAAPRGLLQTPGPRGGAEDPPRSGLRRVSAWEA